MGLNKICLLFTVFLSCSTTGLTIYAQSPADAAAVLSHYIKQGLDSNLTLLDKNITLEKSLLALQEANTYFLPAVSFQGNYTLAKGGRQISVPVGDLLNPVYNTLNQLTSSTRFPTIANVNEQFLPNNFYDIRVRMTYPVLNPELKLNRQIREHQIKLSEADIAIYKRELTRDIKKAYYNYLLAMASVNIYKGAQTVVQRSLMVNQSLYNNGKGLPAYIKRSEAEVMEVAAQLLNAKNTARNAKAYFNFLLNKPLEDSLTLSNPLLEEASLSLKNFPTDISKREELKQIETAIQIQETALQIREAFRKPRLNAFADGGAQGFDFDFNKNSPYYLAGLQLEIPIFHGKRNLIKIEESKQNVKQSLNQQELVGKHLELQAFEATNNVYTAFSNFKASQKQVLATKSYFKLIDLGREEGTNSFIEWLDARNQMTTSEIMEQVYKYKTLIALADYERQHALSPISN
jgi:outer membrane protein TolC